MSVNRLIGLTCLVAATGGAFFLTLHFKGGVMLFLGIFLLAFAVMTAARYPYNGWED